MTPQAKKQARDEQRHKLLPILRPIHVDDELPNDPEELVLFRFESGEVTAGYYNADAERWTYASGDVVFLTVEEWARIPAFNR